MVESETGVIPETAAELWISVIDMTFHRVAKLARSLTWRRTPMSFIGSYVELLRLFGPIDNDAV
jgi:hypothetical protein